MFRFSVCNTCCCFLGVYFFVLVDVCVVCVGVRIKQNGGRFTRFGIYFHCQILAIIKALEEIKNASASKFIIFTDSLFCASKLCYT